MLREICHNESASQNVFETCELGKLDPHQEKSVTIKTHREICLRRVSQENPTHTKKNLLDQHILLTLQRDNTKKNLPDQCVLLTLQKDRLARGLVDELMLRSEHP